jgi:hypothetical protein
MPALLAGVALLAAPLGAQASDYKDPAGRFSMSVPQGWQSATPSNASSLTIVLAKPKSTEAPFEAICIGIYVDTAETKSKTQAEINSLVDGTLTPQFWTEALKGSGEDDFKINSTGNRDKNGRKISNVVFTGSSTENGEKHTAKGKMEVHFIPGSMHSLLCMTEPETWETATVQFDQIFDSYEPQTAALIASAAPRGGSVLTMFAGTKYDGTARVLSQDTPNLAAAGWIASAGSVIVDGTGAWQVCEGINYAGTCRVVSTGQSAGAGQLLSVNSARRLAGREATASMVGTALRHSLSEVARRRAAR